MDKKQIIYWVTTAFVLAFFILGCYFLNKNASEKNIAEIEAIMEQQERDWSAGDMEGYMQGYWQSDSLRFMGKQGITYGWKQQLDNYLQGYPDKEAMGKLTFENISFDPMGDEHMLVVGKWTLNRKKDTLSGYYSLIWEKIDGQWKIIFDHTP
ncbi:MAG: nuclear transport factor 2 family protein [Bacteroidales bacterium]